MNCMLSLPRKHFLFDSVSRSCIIGTTHVFVAGKLLNILQHVHERGGIALHDFDKYLRLPKSYEVRKILAKSGRLIFDRCLHYDSVRG